MQGSEGVLNVSAACSSRAPEADKVREREKDRQYADKDRDRDRDRHRERDRDRHASGPLG